MGGGGAAADSVAMAPGDDVVRLRPASVVWRVGLVAVVSTLFLAGALVGDDHWWPFGPWRMFSTSTPPSGAVVSMSIEVRSPDDARWRPTPITLESVGLNRAEVEGRIPQITADPVRLGTLARSHARLRPDDRPWTAVRLVRNEVVIVDRRPTGEVRHVVLATWTAP